MKCPKGYIMSQDSVCIESNARSIGNINTGDSTMGNWGGSECSSCMQSCHNQQQSCNGIFSYPLGGQCNCNPQCIYWASYNFGPNCGFPPCWGQECIDWQYMCYYSGPSCGSQCLSACPTGWHGAGPDPGGPGQGGGGAGRRMGGPIRKRRIS